MVVPAFRDELCPVVRCLWVDNGLTNTLPNIGDTFSIAWINYFCINCCTRSGRVDRSERYPTDCHEIQMQGFNVSGIYKIKPDDMEPFYVLCDLTTAGGGWTVRNIYTTVCSLWPPFYITIAFRFIAGTAKPFWRFSRFL